MNSKILGRPFNDYYNFVIVNQTKLILIFTEEDFEFFYHDWTNIIWSSDGSFAIFPFSLWGPFHLVKTAYLFKYYEYGKIIFRTISASNYVPHKNDPAKGQKFWNGLIKLGLYLVQDVVGLILFINIILLPRRSLSWKK